MGPPLRGFRCPRIRRCGNIPISRRPRVCDRQRASAISARRSAPAGRPLTSAPMRRRLLVILLGAGVALAGCGGDQAAAHDGVLHGHRRHPLDGPAGRGQKLGFPVAGDQEHHPGRRRRPAADAAGVALAVYPSAAPGTHPERGRDRPDRRLAGGDRRLGADGAPDPGPAAAVGTPRCRPPPPTRSAELAPTGSGAVGGAQVIRVGDRADARGAALGVDQGHRPVRPCGRDRPLRQRRAGQDEHRRGDRLGRRPGLCDAGRRLGRRERRSGPVRRPLRACRPPRARPCLPTSTPTSTCSGRPASSADGVLAQLRKYGPVKRVGAGDPAANSVAFAEYRDPAVRVRAALRPRPRQLRLGDPQPGSRLRPDQRQAAARRRRRGGAVGSGDYGPQLLVDDASTLPHSVLDFFLNYATPGYTQEGPDGRGLQPRLGDRRSERDLRPRPGRDGQPAGSRSPDHQMSQAENPERLAPSTRSRSRTFAS